MISATSGRGNLNTLAQNGTRNNRKPLIVVNGAGTDLGNTTAIKARAKRKHISQVLALLLVDIARERKNHKLEKTFWNTYYCLQSVVVVDGKIHGAYCKNRLCTVCCAIRKADIINRYLPILKQWKEPYFVTLTIKSVPANKLSALIDNMLKGFNLIIEKYEKRELRGKGRKLVGIRSLECNFNPVKRTYNPHFHIIVPDLETAEIIKGEWIKRAKQNWTYHKAQHIVKVFDNEKCLIEVVKYGSKIFTDPNRKEKTPKGTPQTIYVNALYTIVSAFQGKRLFDRFGFGKTKTKVATIGEKRLVSEYFEYNFDLNRTDWIDTETNEPLTDYEPDALLNYMLENYLNLTLS